MKKNAIEKIGDLMWRAVYGNGSFLWQYDPKTKKENKYIDIDRFRLKRFDMFTRDGKKAIYSVYLREDQRLIYRRRTLVNMTGKRVIVYLVGWQQTIYTAGGPKNIKVINYIHEDGSIALDGARNNLELLEHER